MQKSLKYILLSLTAVMMLALAGVAAAQDKDPIAVDTEDWPVFESESYRLQAPEEWVDAETLSDDEIDAFAEDNPQIAATIDIGADLYLINTETAGSLNITAFDAEIPVTLEEVEEIFVTGYPDMGITVDETTTMEMVFGDVLRMTLTLDFPMTDGSMLTLTQFQYAFVEDTLVHLLTVNNGTEPLSDAELIFNAVVDSVELVDEDDMTTEETPDDNGGVTIDGGDDDFQRIDAEGISLSVPADWVDISDNAALDAAVDAVMEENPQLAGLMSAQADANFVVNVFDVNTAANLNVNVIEFPPGLSLDFIAPLLEEQYAQLGITVISTEVTEIAEQEALVVQAQLTLNDPLGGEVTLDQFQYIFLDDTLAYILTATAGDAPLDEMLPIFEAIAESVEIG